jgi:indole-3-glycerol phosphate synthase/phosphoribosylanthranilate isomerase
MAAVQLHGEETAEFVGRLRAVLPSDCEIWQVGRVVKGVLPRLSDFGADRLLLDSATDGARGGTGTSFDWSVLEGLPGRAEMILAGGITPENARGASLSGCYSIDVNSGVEFPGLPGKKDHRKIDELFGNLRLRGRETVL